MLLPFSKFKKKKAAHRASAGLDLGELPYLRWNDPGQVNDLLL